jgi:hypothetical protein
MRRTTTGAIGARRRPPATTAHCRTCRGWIRPPSRPSFSGPTPGLRSASSNSVPASAAPRCGSLDRLLRARRSCSLADSRSFAHGIKILKLFQEDVMGIATRWGNVLRAGSLETKFVAVDFGTLMFTMERGRDVLEVHVFYFPCSLGSIIFCSCVMPVLI